MRTEVTIVNKLGLHARAAAKFVSLASEFNSEVYLVRGGREVSGKSIMGVMMLAAACGACLEIVVCGKDEDEAVRRLESLVTSRFGEAE